MSRLPDKILVVRHGARLDEVMPAALFRDVDVGYDTPLTYGGWKQSQALGAYIAQLLLLPGNPDRRKKRIIIHSSPFARCVQTSIGITAGLAQVVPPTVDISNINESSRATTGIASPYSRVSLKIDPWLGEWMTEDYFGHWDAAFLRSSEIVDRARTLLTSTGQAEGIRVESHSAVRPILAGRPQSPEIPSINALTIQSLVSARGKTYVPPVPNHAVLSTDVIPKGYVAHARDACIGFDKTWVGLRDGGEYGEQWSGFHQRIGVGLEALLQWYLVHRNDVNLIGVPGHGQSTSVDTLSSGANGTTIKDSTNLRSPDISSRSAASKNNTAKNETTNDKMNEATKRLSDTSVDSVAETQTTEPQEVEEELIVILVTHAGGCNKLLHFLTQKPVLIDFPQASLILAVKNADFEGAGQLDTLSKQYKVILQASTDHLNPAAKFKTIKDLATVDIGVTRHSRSTSRHSRSGSRSNRRTTLTTIPCVDTAPPMGLWGQKRQPESGSMSAVSVSPSAALWGQGRQPESGNVSTASSASTTLWSQAPQPESGSISASAATFGSSQTGLWRPNGGPTRRATMNELDSTTTD